jgi:hypothetical protein
MQTDNEIKVLESELSSIEHLIPTEDNLERIVQLKENIRMLKKVALIPEPKKVPCLDYYQGRIKRMQKKR